MVVASCIDLFNNKKLCNMIAGNNDIKFSFFTIKILTLHLKKRVYARVTIKLRNVFYMNNIYYNAQLNN